MIVYDCEIKNMIPEKNQANRPHLQYCAGWNDYVGMGVAVICVYDYTTDTMHTITDDRLDEFNALVASCGYAIGYNNSRFDNALLNAHGCHVPPANTYDIYMQVIHAAGLTNRPYREWKGHRLDDIARANGISGKTGLGAAAPELYQGDRIEELHTYCRNDVEMTRRIFDLILLGKLVSPVTGKPLNVKTPQQVLGAVQPGLPMGAA